MQLRRVVEMADMLPHVDFAEQQTVGSLRADMVIHLPGGQQIVVDSKSPIQSYREAVDAPDEATRAERLKDHAQKVRSYVDALGAKSYFEQFQPSPEFVVLFMPGDHFLAAALQADPTLLDRAIARRVLLATPTTFIALLKSAAFGWSHQAATQNVAEIKLAGQQLHERLAVFAEHLESAGRNLDAAVRGYNSAVGSFEQNLLPGARRLAEIGARSARQVPELPGLEVSPREITKRS
jgi:DNA recombination protein RmuC